MFLMLNVRPQPAANYLSLAQSLKNGKTASLAVSKSKNIHLLQLLKLVVTVGLLGK